MINLAGHRDPDPIIEAELFCAGIETVRADQPAAQEVATRITGRLGAFAFERAWYYWVATGPVPLDVAKALYEQRPYGRRDVRVAGHCGCPAPREWARLVDADGRQLTLLRNGDRALIAQYHAGTLPEFWGNAIERLVHEHRLVDTEEERYALAVDGFVDIYHIDSQAGLVLYANAIRGPRA